MKVLFLCTGNSCRSQMAEGWLRSLSQGRIDAWSAGIEAHGKNPRAIAAMDKAGIDISDQESTMLTEAMLAGVDLIVTVCRHADEHCPLLPPGAEKRHWPIEDPARATESEEEITRKFEVVRDEIRDRVEQLLAEILHD